MLSIITYDTSRELTSLDFLSETRELSSVIVCPNPLVADGFRDKLDISTYSSGSVEVVTIAKFVSDLVQKHADNLKITRKSELMVILAGVWKSKFQELPDELFNQSFTLFTDLRSYSLDANLINEVLNHLDPKMAEVIAVFWQIVESPVLGILDEHAAYSYLAEKIKESGANEASVNMIFYGFSHLSGSQVDLLKSLALNNELFIPINKSALEYAIDFDWPKWLDAEFETPPQVESESIDRTYNTFLKNRLGDSLLCWEGKNSEALDVFIAEKKPDFNQVLEIPLGGLFFKTSADLLSSLIRETFNDLKKKLNGMISSEELQAKVSNLFQEELEKKTKNFRKLKVYDLIIKEIDKMTELTDAFSEFGLFEIGLLEEVVQLNSPRVSSIPLSQQKCRGEVKGLASLETFDQDKDTVLVISGKYSPLKGKDDFYSEEVMEILSSIGPVKRPEFEFQIVSSNLKEIISSEKTHLFIEKDLLEHDLNWASVFKNYNLIALNQEDEAKDNTILDVSRERIQKAEIKMKKLSASRLQTYLDCPRKYFHSYVEELDIRVNSNELILAMDMGSLQHKVIESYMKTHKTWSESEHLKITQGVLEDFIEAQNLCLNELDKESYLIEIRNYSSNGIKALLDFYLMDDNCRFEFEKSIKDEEITGSIDCLAQTKYGTFIIDFKRSEASIPSPAEVEKFKKIQLLFYCRYSKVTPTELAMIGYFNLSDIKTSKLMVFHEELVPILGELPNLKVISPVLPKYELPEKLHEFSTFMDQKWQEMKDDKEFRIKPVKTDSCGFCPAKTICPRTEVENV
ncbi:MAG: PD-(D/E)XK nuclease family protein [Deltaproteobacteria bacterium]|nr:MAG: PD-(D/E)XK nuclease family protein [Deltaproteobacteria bacterium]